MAAQQQRYPTQTTNEATSEAWNPQDDSSLDTNSCFFEIVGHVQILDTSLSGIGLIL